MTPNALLDAGRRFLFPMEIYVNRIQKVQGVGSTGDEVSRATV